MRPHGFYAVQTLCFVLLTTLSLEKELTYESRVTIWELELVHLRFAKSLSRYPCPADRQTVILPPVAVSTKYDLSHRHAGILHTSIRRPEVDCSDGRVRFENGDTSNLLTISAASENSCLSGEELRLKINIDAQGESGTGTSFHTSVYSAQTSSQWQKQHLLEETGKAVLQIKWRVTCGPHKVGGHHREKREVSDAASSNSTANNLFNATSTDVMDNSTTLTGDVQSTPASNTTTDRPLDTTAPSEINATEISQSGGLADVPSLNDSSANNTSEDSNKLFSLISSLLQSTTSPTVSEAQNSTEARAINSSSTTTTATLKSSLSPSIADKESKVNPTKSGINAPAAGESKQLQNTTSTLKTTTTRRPTRPGERPLETASSQSTQSTTTTTAKPTPTTPATSTAKPTTTGRLKRPGERPLGTPSTQSTTTTTTATTIPTPTTSTSSTAKTTTTRRPTRPGERPLRTSSTQSTQSTTTTTTTTTIPTPTTSTSSTAKTSTTRRPTRPGDRPLGQSTPTTSKSTTATTSKATPAMPESTSKVTQGSTATTKGTQTTVKTTTVRRTRPGERPIPTIPPKPPTDNIKTSSTKTTTKQPATKPTRPWEKPVEKIPSPSTTSTARPLKPWEKPVVVEPETTKKDVIFTARPQTDVPDQSIYIGKTGETKGVTSSPGLMAKKQAMETDSGPDEDMVWPIVLGLVIGIPTIIVVAIAVTVVQKKHFNRGVPTRYLSSPGYFERRPPAVPFVSRPPSSTTCSLEKPPSGIEV